jgi:hypothetical protein
MSIPKWLLPVIAIVAAIAVGFAAFLVGGKFAPATPASAFVPPATETAQVLAPVAVDDGDDGDDESDDGENVGESEPGGGSGTGDSADESPVVGEREVVVPEDDPAASDTELLRLIDLIGLSPDLLLGLIHLGAGDRDDDPCAPRDGDPADGCPSGLGGVVLFDEHLPPLWMNAQAFPQTHAALHDLRTAPALDPALVCDIAQEDADEATLRIRATAPGTWTVRYWPTDDPAHESTAGPVSSSDAQIAAWGIESDDLDHGFYIAEQCLRLPGLEINTPYTAVVSGVDTHGRVPPDFTFQFNSDGAPHHPELELQPVGQNLLLASAPHAADETVTTHAYLVPSGTAPTCSTAETDATTLNQLTAVDHVPLGDSDRLVLNVPAENTEKSVVSYRVPEGATLLVCARWFPGGDAPTWESDQANYESSAIARTGDRNLPQLEFTSFTPRDDRTVDLQIRVATVEGTACSRIPWGSGDTLPLTLCDASSNAGGGAETSETSDSVRLSDRGFSGDLVVRVDATFSSGETSETTYVLPAGSGSCVGVCPLPAATHWAIATIGGTMNLTESWVTGLQNGGAAGWTITNVASGAVEGLTSLAPQIDRNADWEYSAPGFNANVGARIDIRVDRPVDWQFLTYTGTPAAAMSCGAHPVPVQTSGRTDDGVIRIALPQVCLGGHYNGVLHLTDDAGHESVWGPPGMTSTGFWPASIMSVPTLDATIRYRVDAQSTSQSYVQHLGLGWFGGERTLTNDHADPAGSRCTEDGLVISQGHFEDSLPASFTAGLALLMVPQQSTSDGHCSGRTLDVLTTPEFTTLTIEQLGNADGVVLEGSNWTVHIWADPR